MEQQSSMPTVDQALEFLVCLMRSPQLAEHSSLGCDVYIPNVVRTYLIQVENLKFPQQMIQTRAEDISPMFVAAAWELCRLGVLRPGARKYFGQSMPEGVGYSIMPSSDAWLTSTDDHFIPTQPNAFSQLLEPFGTRFGLGFQQRAQEAVKCRWAGANLACCAMCGAAGESILLALAIAKTGDEGPVLREYRSAKGRKLVRDRVFGQAPASLQRQSQSFTDLLDYWRDEASHGQASDFSQFEAYEALARLLRFAHFANDHWEELTE